MDAFVSRKRKRSGGPQQAATPPAQSPLNRSNLPQQQDEESTDFKLAVLASLHPDLDEATLLEALLASEGCVEEASEVVTGSKIISPRKRSAVGYQSSLSSYRITAQNSGPAKRLLVKKGKTLYLYSPEDIEAHTPCSIIHNFLPPEQADALLLELLEEASSYSKLEFKLFDRVVKSPHTFCFYVNSLAEAEEQKTEYIYDGRRVEVSLLRLCTKLGFPLIIAGRSTKPS